MNELTIYLAETPQASKKEFLATTEPLSSQQNNEDLPFEIRLDRYTREQWCRHNPTNIDSDDKWQSLWLKSVDKRGKISGFLKFLKGRSKAAYGKFDSPEPDEVTGEDRTALFLVPFEQPPFPSKDILEREGVANEGDMIFIKYCYDEKEILNKPPPQKAVQQMQTSNHLKQVPNSSGQSRQPRQASRPVQKKQTVPSSSFGGGLLGNLLQAQARTNMHLDAVPASRKTDKSKTNNNSLEGGVGVVGGNGGDDIHGGMITSSGQVIANFRAKNEKKLLAFQSSSTDTEIRIPISLGDEIRVLPTIEEKEKVTMDVLRFIIDELAEELGEDEWVVTKESSGFIDEKTIVIYKAGYAPPEVLEELNQGEVPDEVKQQQRTMREAMIREEQKKARQLHDNNTKRAFENRSDVIGLNNNKRDRRSIEEIQKDMNHENKRSR